MRDNQISFFRCPVCAQPLRRGEGVLVCPSGHSFDVAKRGYVNLLRNSGPGEKRHGDDAMMARARTEFLEQGYYDPLADAVCDALREYVRPGARVLDCGCGQCFYTGRAAKALPGSAFGGIDISKAAINEGARRPCGAQLAVAGVFALPVADGSCGGLVNLFAPLAPEEFARVLEEGGALVRAVPTQRHLWQLKQAVYDRPYENKPTDRSIEGFSLRGARRLEYSIALDSQADIDALFRMTPYYYKTGKGDQHKLLALERLETQVGFEVLIYQKGG